MLNNWIQKVASHYDVEVPRLRCFANGSVRGLLLEQFQTQCVAGISFISIKNGREKMIGLLPIINKVKQARTTCGIFESLAIQCSKTLKSHSHGIRVY